MLSDLLEQLDRYNAEIMENELELNTAVLERLRRFYEENKEGLDEAERLLEVALETRPPEPSHVDLNAVRYAVPGTGLRVRKESPEERAYSEKKDSLDKRLNEYLSDLGIRHVTSITTASEILRIIGLDPTNFKIVPIFFIGQNSQVNIHKLEDRGYGLLFEVVGEIVQGLNPDQDYNATYWSGGTDYVSRFFQHGKWKHLGLESLLRNPYGIVHVQHDINSPEKPFPDESEDVAILKTLGSLSSGGNYGQTYLRFWKKMTDSLRIGGIVISSYEVPEEFRVHYLPIVNLDGSGRDFLEFNSVTPRVTHHFPTRIYFFQKVA